MTNLFDLHASVLPGVPLVESPFFSDLCETTWSGETLRIAKDLNSFGYAVFPLKKYDSKFEEYSKGIMNDFHARFDWQGWKASDTVSLRIQDAWRFDYRVRYFACLPMVLNLLENLYGRKAIPFQTLNFPVGTQQSLHSDHIHFNSMPERFMCGVWIPFEHCHNENGPLFYYPGSHKWPSFGNEHIGISGASLNSSYPNQSNYSKLWEAIAKHQGVEKVKFICEPGDALIWSSNLVHGGSEMINKNLTRWSQVNHYFFEGCGYTTPLANDINHGEIFFREITNIQTNKIVENVITGRKVSSFTSSRLRPQFLDNNQVPNDFNSQNYLRLNPDVLKAGIDPATHYIQFGRSEGRQY